MNRGTTAIAAVICLAGPAAGQETLKWNELTALDRQALGQLSATAERNGLVFHYRPGDHGDSALDEAFLRNERRLHEVTELLRIRLEGPVHVFLYRDLRDLKTTTGASEESTVVAFSNGTASVHQSIDFDSVHEFAHLVALRFPRGVDSSTDDFAVEGLATSLAESDEGIPIHDWAHVYHRAGLLPALFELRGRWPEGAAGGVHPYHVAGSFVGWLIERFGVAAVKRWYVQSTEAHLAFGETFPKLEREWRDWLAGREVADVSERHVLGKLGLIDEVIPDALASAEGEPIFDGESLQGWVPEDPARWSVRDGLLVGSHDGPWTKIHSEKTFPADTGIRLRLRLVEGDAVQVRLNDSGQEANEAIFARWQTFLSLRTGGYAAADQFKIEPGRWHDVVFVTQGGTGRLYVDGLRVLESRDGLFRTEGRVSIGVDRGTLEVQDAVVFSPPAEAPRASRARSGLDRLVGRMDIPGERAAAFVALRSLGIEDIEALTGRLGEAVRDKDSRRARLLAEALSVTGRSTSSVIGALADLVPGAEPETRALILRSIANGALYAEDAELLGWYEASLRQWAAEGLCYSPDPDQPTLAWCEYVRAIRRVKIRRAGTDPEALLASARLIFKEREQMQGWIAPRRDAPSAVSDLTSFGRHGTRFELEAIAELTADLSSSDRQQAAPIFEELGRYLVFEKPRPIEIRVEPRAGTGEPYEERVLGGARFAVQWRDDYRIALSGAILGATSDPQLENLSALHLLYSCDRADRIRALTHLREVDPRPPGAVQHLAANLQDGDAVVVRELITTLGMIGPAAKDAIPTLEKLTEHDDPQIAERAKAALRQVRGR